MQAKDISTKDILAYIGQYNGEWCFYFGPEDFVGEPRQIVNAVPPGTPMKVVQAKMRSLLKRGLVEGCGCGCRGDYYLTEKGKGFLHSID